MIDPKHECPSVAAPKLRLDGDILWTVGVGLPVIFEALQKIVPGLVWFSRIEGEYQDNIRVIATTGTVAESISIKGTVCKFVDGDEIEEYELTDSIAKKLGVDLEKLEVLSSAQTPVWLITSHDEHWTSIRLVTDEILRKVISGVLGQINFSLNKVVSWDEAAVDALALVVREYAGRHIQLATRQEQAADAGQISINLEIKPENRTIKEKLAALNPFYQGTYRKIGCLELGSGTIKRL